MRRKLLEHSELGRRLLEISALSPLEFVTRHFENDVVRAGLLFFNGLREVDLRLKGFGHSIPALFASRAKAQMAVGGSSSLARALVSAAFPVAPGAFPWSTFAENLSGAFLLALLLTLAVEHLADRPWVLPLLGTGTLGAYTTFATVSLELERLVADGSAGLAIAYAAATLVAGLRGAARNGGGPASHPPAGKERTMKIEGTGVRLSVYVGESDRHHGRPLYTEIVQRARKAGLAGATVLRGVEGFGASSVIHTARLLTFSEDLPMIIEIVDAAERIDAFIPELDTLVTEGLIVREEVEVVRYLAREHGGPGT